MLSGIISLPVATASENSQALAEVSDFGLTDMGYTGEGPWTYRILHDPALKNELAQISRAKTYGCVDIVTLQPCPPHVYLSQDRYVVEEWDLPGGTWRFNGVFDGNYMSSFWVHRLTDSTQCRSSESSHCGLCCASTAPPHQANPPIRTRYSRYCAFSSYFGNLAVIGHWN